jgi:hypothetical protein
MKGSLMQIKWELVVAAISGYIIVAAYQAWFLVRAIKHITNENMRLHISTTEDWATVIRKYIAGIWVGLGIANGLLGAIVAILIFR